MSPYYQLSEHVSLTEVDDEAVLLDCESGAYFGLNHVGLMLVNLLQQGLSQETAQRKLADHYETSEQQVIDDTNSLIIEMLNRNLLGLSSSSETKT